MTAPSPLPVIIESDPGIDDALALWLALHSPELDVRGIAVTYGNTTLENAFRNAVELVRRTGRRVTLAVGARRPLTRSLAVALETHGASGLGYAAVPTAGVALDFVKPLDRLLADQPSPVTLVTLGPVTGLARLLRREPELVRRTVARHVAMIGTLEAPGNTTPHSEFNAWADPEALATVVAAELPTDIVGLDVTQQIVLKPREVERLGQAESDEARWWYDALRFYVEFHQNYERRDGCVIHDVLPIAALIQPDVLEFRPQRISVSLDAGDQRGRTLVDPAGARVRVAAKVDVAAVRVLVFERVLPWAGAAAASVS